MSTPQEFVERALAASSSRACVVLVRSQSIANVRWARNTLTTNGETLATAVSVVALVDVPGGIAAGSVTLNNPGLDGLADLVRRAEHVAVEEGPADDAAELAADVAASSDWSDDPTEREPSRCCGQSVHRLGLARRAALSRDASAVRQREMGICNSVMHRDGSLSFHSW